MTLKEKENLLFKLFKMGIKNINEGRNNFGYSLTYFDNKANSLEELNSKILHNNVKSTLDFSLTNNILKIEIFYLTSKDKILIIKTNHFKTEQEINKIIEESKNKLLKLEPQLIQSKLFFYDKELLLLLRENKIPEFLQLRKEWEWENVVFKAQENEI
ncbi:hypothetical protein [Helicobacter sp. MIT 05-5294]|uniref:hypothetical protein n=1 Tax=Helicobacter sp. MIT 05-5294 TaxID=1548150 RepID=UPI00051FDC0A|nr:hypothetical protein [Helicobacter sp. MIT 05-5294]TLD85558.1 hypothetical protein LS69_008905 [Helicobacter sp. MIT 05-5294]